MLNGERRISFEVIFLQFHSELWCNQPNTSSSISLAGRTETCCSCLLLWDISSSCLPQTGAIVAWVCDHVRTTMQEWINAIRKLFRRAFYHCRLYIGWAHFSTFQVQKIDHQRLLVRIYIYIYVLSRPMQCIWVANRKWMSWVDLTRWPGIVSHFATHPKTWTPFSSIYISLDWTYNAHTQIAFSCTHACSLLLHYEVRNL